ncbi:uncharacterized protein LOC105702909 [Orussus abietinus]|uniref:uncharacterized protein LOC105702909 n=1 Tax=Orussus abietinus TaxID=222816 RepID=UPI0006263445|nr:uncharacterized protein LOC105702909 [Orussus abietinus]
MATGESRIPSCATKKSLLPKRRILGTATETRRPVVLPGFPRFAIPEGPSTSPKKSANLLATSSPMETDLDDITVLEKEINSTFARPSIWNKGEAVGDAISIDGARIDVRGCVFSELLAERKEPTSRISSTGGMVNSTFLAEGELRSTSAAFDTKEKEDALNGTYVLGSQSLKQGSLGEKKISQTMTLSKSTDHEDEKIDSGSRRIGAKAFDETRILTSPGRSGAGFSGGNATTKTRVPENVIFELTRNPLSHSVAKRHPVGIPAPQGSALERMQNRLTKQQQQPQRPGEVVPSPAPFLKPEDPASNRSSTGSLGDCFVGKGCGVSPTKPPTGPTALFTLNDTFIKERAYSAVSATQRHGRAPGREFSRDRVSVENKAFDLANATFDVDSNRLRRDSSRAYSSILSEEEMKFSFLEGRGAVSSSFLKDLSAAGEASTVGHPNSAMAAAMAERRAAVEGSADFLGRPAGPDVVELSLEKIFKSRVNEMTRSSAQSAGINAEPLRAAFTWARGALQGVSQLDMDQRRLNAPFRHGVTLGDPRMDQSTSPTALRQAESLRLAGEPLTPTAPPGEGADLRDRESVCPSSLDLFYDSKCTDIAAIGLADISSGPYSLLELTGAAESPLEKEEDDDEEDLECAAPPTKGATIAPHYLMLNKQNSFEHDESLGILTPDQMTDFTMAMESSRTPSCENLPGIGTTPARTTLAGRSEMSARRPSEVAVSVTYEEGNNEASSFVEETATSKVERTSSPEELPLDPRPVVEVAEVGEPGEAGEAGRSVPASFVTSVTSITSLEAGYQGDGENSRPASRGADPPPELVEPAPEPAADVPAACRQDPMTDSDFFTESDADAHEEIGKGDRRAQVIDGTLFCAPGGRRCPSFTGEEMDSSGIYSDLDKRQDERVQEDASLALVAPPRSKGGTPDTADSISQKSQLSPSGKPELVRVITECLQVPPSTLDISVDSNSSVKTLELTVVESQHDKSPPKESVKSESVPLKKYKMPKKNVVSKIKAMIESGPKEEAEKDIAWRTQRIPRKTGRWDEVMSKIEAGKTEQRSRPPRKEIKSRILQNLGPASSSTSSSSSATSRRTANDNSSKSKRRTRGRPEGTSSARETAHSSVHSSMSDLSGATGKDITKRSPCALDSQRKTPSTRTNQQACTSNVDVKRSCLDSGKNNPDKSPTVPRKPPVSRRLSCNTSPKTLQHGTSVLTKDRASKDSTAGSANSSASSRSLVETQDRGVQTEPSYESIYLRRADLSVQALSVIVQYLAHRLDGFSSPKLREEFQKMKTEWTAARVEVEELRARHAEVKEKLDVQRAEHQRAVDLRKDLESRHAQRVSELEAILEDERAKFDVRLRTSLRDSAAEQEALVTRLRAEHEAEAARRDAESDRRSAVHDQGAALRAEVESLRSVLDIRSQEIAALRTELVGLKREIEVKEALEQRAETLEARCEDLKAQLQTKDSFERQMVHENKLLLESFHQESKQNKRLSQLNEELQWRLRHNNEVVTVLANQLASPPQRLTRSLGPERINHAHSPDDSPPGSPMIKSMVEKGDSVSWTLEIEETPEAMASRLLRRSGSGSTSAPGVPSRGGTSGSPGEFGSKRHGPATSSAAASTAQPMGVKLAPGAATVSRQSSLRSTTQRAVVLRTRSKSVSVGDSKPDSWSPNFNSTPVVRRRPRSDASASPVAVAAAAAAAVAAAAGSNSTGDCSPTSGPKPQEAGGEAMISEETSASSSEDESSASSDIPRLAMELSWSESEG